MTQATAEYETFTTPADVWESVISHCLSKTPFDNLSSLRADLDERIDRFISEEFGEEGWTPAGMGQRSEEYDRLAFAKVLRQPKECEACRNGRKPADFCDSGGKIFELFKQGEKVYVWYRPGLCPRWTKAKVVKAERENVPVETGRRGFGR